MSAISEFERIESLVKSGELEKMSFALVRKERDVLLRETPTSNNPQFVQRWDRVLFALNERIGRELAWWQKPLGAIAIAVLSAVLSAALTFWLGLT
ncbi:MAG: hypothetical protein Q8O81_06680 [Giesbergeria sp.]|nr:hypothetical protein [Giesbergeria sp.]